MQGIAFCCLDSLILTGDQDNQLSDGKVSHERPMTLMTVPSAEQLIVHRKNKQ